MQRFLNPLLGLLIASAVSVWLWVLIGQAGACLFNIHQINT